VRSRAGRRTAQRLWRSCAIRDDVSVSWHQCVSAPGGTTASVRAVTPLRYGKGAHSHHALTEPRLTELAGLVGRDLSGLPARGVRLPVDLGDLLQHTRRYREGEVVLVPDHAEDGPDVAGVLKRVGDEARDARDGRQPGRSAHPVDVRRQVDRPLLRLEQQLHAMHGRTESDTEREEGRSSVEGVSQDSQVCPAELGASSSSPTGQSAATPLATAAVMAARARFLQSVTRG